jgi:hypothetical protein
MSTFTIQDENTRDLLEYALWSRAAMEADELRVELEKMGDDWLLGDSTAMRRGDTALDTLVTTTRDDIGRVRVTALGESVEISIPPPGMAGELAYCMDHIEECVCDAPPNVREEMLAVRDAAVALLAIVEPAESVA